MKTALLYVLACALFAMVVISPLVAHTYYPEHQLPSLMLILLFIPGLWLFMLAVARSSAADGVATGCHHRWDARSEDLAGRQYAKCVLCGAETLLP